ncbi:uncharacterized protein BDFB_006066 [Asbolus verrucosus]|uniref:Uncharacterized protein n=1 Tax=Asbolus verrucosus TaxID=1661398 RepID=A0A482VWX4_ASBVE|nr:uncharacterized protein BDFB_006066 [Asbolus verrucosus]
MFRRRGERSEKASAKWRKIEETVLPTAKLRFCPEQLQNLNFIFQKRLQEKIESASDKSLLLARSVTERLVQRLTCCAGILDPRFASKFLIANHDQLSGNLPSRSLEYIIRLDSLSTPPIYLTDPRPRYSIIETDPDYPAAYARIRLHTTTLKIWGDCANSGGYLRRDKVQARLVELLAQAAASEIPNSPLNVDESIHCGTPGKIVDAHALHQILKIPSEQHVFYGPGGNVPRFPDPRDFRLAIVDEPGGARLKIEFLSPTLSNFSIDVRILIGIGIDSWPSSTNFPARITLGHTDCLLYHQAAQTGMYLVGYGVQSSAWQIRMPAAQDAILNHYGPNSTIKTILDVLFDALEDIDKVRHVKKQVSYKILNRYIFLTMLLKRLEEQSTTPSNDLLDWSPMYLSTHVLKILDKTIEILHHQNLPNYFFKKSNLLVNPGHLCEDDYVIEANNVKLYIIRLFDEALMSTRGNQEFHKIIASQESETILLHKWKDLIENLLPPAGTRGRRFCFAGSKNKQEVAHTEYTVRQMEYIGLLLQNLLDVKQVILTDDSYMSDDSIIKVDTNIEENHLEDVIFLLVTIMDQARDKYLAGQANPTIIKNRSKIKAQFNSCTSKLIDTIRKDKDMVNLTYEDDLALVKVILKWLYKAMDQNKRYLAPILRPYLSTLFTASHSISWHLDFIKQRMNKDELNALGYFAKLVNDTKITPAEGLIDAVNKNWMWAKSMLKMVEKNTLRVVFISDRGKVYRHILSLPSYQRNRATESLLGDVPETKKQHTLPSNRNYFSTILNQRNKSESLETVIVIDHFRVVGFRDDYPENTPQHDILKNSSPLTLLLSETNRKGEHRGYGDILKSLQSMQKLNVSAVCGAAALDSISKFQMFQQVTTNLPQEDRFEIMELIQTMQSIKPKKSTKRWSNTLPQSRKITPKCEKYTPKEESAGIRADGGHRKRIEASGTLIGSCRAARIREDSSVLLFQDSFKIKSLLNKSESFKF